MLQDGQASNLSDMGQMWQLDQSFEAQMATADRDALLDGWQTALRRTLL
jgi:glycerol kinase